LHLKPDCFFIPSLMQTEKTPLRKILISLSTVAVCLGFCLNLHAEWGPGKILYDQNGAEKYHIIQRFDQGGFGTVFLAIELQSNHSVVVIKKFHSSTAEQVLVPHQEILARMAAPYRGSLMPFQLDYIEARTVLWLTEHPIVVMPRALGTALDSLPNTVLDPEKSDNRYRLAEIFNVARGVFAGIEELHNMGRAHNDISLKNILRLQSGRYVLSDFDVSTKFGQSPLTTHYETSSPEFYFRTITDSTSDLFSFALVLYHLAFGENPLVEVFGKPDNPLLRITDPPANRAEFYGKILTSKKHLNNFVGFLRAKFDVLGSQIAESDPTFPIEALDYLKEIMTSFLQPTPSERTSSIAKQLNCSAEIPEILARLRKHATERVQVTPIPFGFSRLSCQLLMLETTARIKMRSTIIH
jgi:serine/threonine protein kinase